MTHLPLPPQSIRAALKRLGAQLPKLGCAAALEVGRRETDLTTPVLQPIEELGALASPSSSLHL